MKEKDVKEKLHFKKDENGKRFLYISMGRFLTEIFQPFSTFFDNFEWSWTELRGQAWDGEKMDTE